MIEELNNNLFLSINRLANKFKLIDISAVVTAEYLPFFFIGVLLYLWFYSRGDGKNHALYAGYSALSGVSFNLLITLFYFHPRPFMNRMGTALINHVPETSFPSDHTTLMLSIAITLFLIRAERKIGAALFLLGIIGGLTRVFCGIHYPFDILGSLIVAFFSSTLVLCFKGNLVTVNQYIINTYFQIVRKKTAKANSADSKSRATDKQR